MSNGDVLGAELGIKSIDPEGAGSSFFQSHHTDVDTGLPIISPSGAASSALGAVGNVASMIGKEIVTDVPKIIGGIGALINGFRRGIVARSQERQAEYQKKVEAAKAENPQLSHPEAHEQVSEKLGYAQPPKSDDVILTRAEFDELLKGRMVEKAMPHPETVTLSRTEFDNLLHKHVVPALVKKHHRHLPRLTKAEIHSLLATYIKKSASQYKRPALHHKRQTKQPPLQKALLRQVRPPSGWWVTR